MFLITTLSFSSSATAAEKEQKQSGASSKQDSTIDRDPVNRIIAGWPERPRLGASQMLSAYGIPQQATPEKLVWHGPGLYKRITVTKEEHHHDFPKPHMDYLEHTIEFRAGK